MGVAFVERLDGDGLVLTVERESKFLTRRAQNAVVDDIVSRGWLRHGEADGIRDGNWSDVCLSFW